MVPSVFHHSVRKYSAAQLEWMDCLAVRTAGGISFVESFFRYVLEVTEENYNKNGFFTCPFFGGG